MHKKDALHLVKTIIPFEKHRLRVPISKTHHHVDGSLHFSIDHRGGGEQREQKETPSEPWKKEHRKEFNLMTK
jgi:hypothetical protein